MSQPMRHVDVTSAPDVAALAADPARALDVPADAIPSVLNAVAVQKAALDVATSILAARLAAMASLPAVTDNDDDIIHDVNEVARIARRSVPWVRQRGHTLPGFRQPGGKGTRVAWSRAALVTWANGGSG